MSTTATLTVAQISPTGVTANTMRAGYNISVLAKPLDANGNPSGARVTYASSNNAVAVPTPCQVQDGNAAQEILGVAPGSAVITATASDTGQTVTFTVTVTS